MVWDGMLWYMAWRFALVHDQSCREPIAWGPKPRNRDGNAVKNQIFPHNQPKTMAIWNIYIRLGSPSPLQIQIVVCVCELLWALWRAASDIWPVAAFWLSRSLSFVDFVVRNQSQVDFGLARRSNWFSWLPFSCAPSDLYKLNSSYRLPGN